MNGLLSNNHRFGYGQFDATVNPSYYPGGIDALNRDLKQKWRSGYSTKNSKLYSR